MFVSIEKLIKAAALTGVMGFTTGASAMAADDTVHKIKGGTIPVTVDLTNVQTAAGPIYVSIQKEDQYMGMKGFGGVIKTAVQGQMSETFDVDAPGEYAVSVWHDLNDNGVFDMDDQYRPLEGWGGSGNAPTDRKPTFDEVKVTVPHHGLTLAVGINYPG